MSTPVYSGRLLAVVAIGALTFSSPTFADPDEAWLTRAPLATDIRPLLVVVLDHSAAMAQRMDVVARYDPSTDYSEAVAAPDRCEPDDVYWRRGPGPAPDCRSMAGLALVPATAGSGLHCDRARDSLARHGLFIAARAAQWRSVAGGGYWDAPSADREDAVECRSDRGSHGSETGQWYAANGPQGPWDSTPGEEIDWDAPPLGDAYIFYTGNYLNYLASDRQTIETSLAEFARAMLVEAIGATDDLDIALIRLSDREPDAEGGYVALAPTPAVTAASLLSTELENMPASGAAPLAEALVEVAAWLSGAPVLYGDDARADAAARDPANPANYLSPFASSCRPVTIALVTAGQPSQDEGARLAAERLPGFSALTGGCGASCVPQLASWLLRSDLRDDLTGLQSASVTWLVPSPAPGLVGEAQALTAAKVAFAQDPLSYANIIARSLQHDAAVPAGMQLSAAGLLRADDSRHLPAVFYGLSAPQIRERWLGNALRYGLRGPASALEAPVVTGSDGEPALDPATGLPRPESISEWSDRPDGEALLNDSAAARLPAAASRRIYSDLTADALNSNRNRLEPGNSSLTATILGLGPRDAETPEDVINWLLNEPALGDPGLRPPVTAGDADDDSRTIFLATHDGLLHAFDADTGIERWAFLPRTLLPRLPGLMRNEATTARSHGVDGPLVLHRHDPDGNGNIDPSAGEHLWLLFGLGRGGRGYYALDVTNPDEPQLMWSLGAEGGGDGALSLPEPVVLRLAIDGAAQDFGAWVVMLAGGYDRAYDHSHPGSSAAGASLSILDATTGRSLWRAAGNGSLQPDLHLPAMSASLASAPRVLDLDGDGHADRLYIIDIEGGLWRFDLRNGAVPSELASARLLARLGGDGQRFYATPDLSAIRWAAGLEFAVSVGSGWLARPRDTNVTDRIYSIRDRTTADTTVLTDADLHDATLGAAPMPATAPGWFVRLDRHGAGEKMIGSSVTFDHRLYFTTYQPVPAPPSAICGPPPGIRRLHMLDVRTGLEAPRAELPEGSPRDEILGSGLPPALRFAFPRPWDGACADCRPRPFAIAGAELFDAGFGNDPVKTSWRKLPDAPASH